MLCLVCILGCRAKPAGGSGDPLDTSYSTGETGSDAQGPVASAKTTRDGRASAADSLCPTGPAEDHDGQRKLALVIGVGDYRAAEISDLKGPPHDAQKMYQLLTEVYGFPKQNVCLLTDSQATHQRVLERLETHLVAQAKENDPVVIYFAGHGSQVRDKNGDEPDEWDETLLPHDARTPGVPALTDDQLNGILSRLYAKTKKLTVVVDACNAGSGTRGEALARWTAPESPSASSPSSSGVVGNSSPASSAEWQGDGGRTWQPAEMPEAVFVAAAADGSTALERDEKGLFTESLLELLAENPLQPLSWQDVALQLPPRLRAKRTDQVPYFSGQLGRLVWDSSSSTAPSSITTAVQDGTRLGWSIQKLEGEEVVLTGPPWMAGFSTGALVRVYPRTATAQALRDPAQSVALLEVVRQQGPTVYARRVTRTSGTGSTTATPPTLEPGQLALLVRPGQQALRLTFSMRSPKLSGGVEARRAQTITSALQADDAARMVVAQQATGGDFELQVSASGQLQLINATGRITNTFGTDPAQEAAQVVRSLWQHARQQALLQLQGEGGSMFSNHQTLKAQVIPASRQPSCARGVFTQAAPNQTQPIPLCHAYQVKVSLSAASPRPLLVGGMLLYSDGGLEAFPTHNKLVRLEPGSSVVFPEVYQATPPLETEEALLVFGTQEENPVLWGRFSSPAVASMTGEVHRSGERSSAQLQAQLQYLLEPGNRGGTRLEDTSTDSTGLWTSTFVPTRVEANSRFLVSSTTGPGAVSSAALTREYTVANFDIRPYLPDSPQSGLHRVLMQAETLAKQAGEDGVPYKQHDWSGSSDVINLSRGIDCSRAIWFAFTRAGLPYTPEDRYVATAGMVGNNSPMSRHFELCPVDKPLLPGDVLVYRDEGRGAGHVVMVIDPDKRIAWGSHGWDGNSREGLVSDRGVEYQRIKYKQDWERWDRKTMKRVACWRHRLLAEEARSPAGQAGVTALSQACSAQRCL